jgi:hypothetical protein
MNATQYKNRANIRINTNMTFKDINAFDLKTDHTENGRRFLSKKEGTPLFMQIESMEEDPSIPPLSSYEKKEDAHAIQQKLFDETD